MACWIWRKQRKYRQSEEGHDLKHAKRDIWEGKINNNFDKKDKIAEEENTTRKMNMSQGCTINGTEGRKKTKTLGET